MAKCCSCKRSRAIPICLAVLIVCGVVTLAIYVVVFYSGSSTSVAPGEVVVLSNRTSNTWCEAETVSIDSGKGGLGFNASVVPKLESKVITQSFDVSTTLPAGHGRAQWHFKLKAQSQIDVLECANVSNVMLYVFRGTEIKEDCVTHISFHNYHSGERSFDDDDCSKIIVVRQRVKKCGKGQKQRVTKLIPADDSYIIFYDSINDVESPVFATITLQRELYDLSNALHNCSSANSACILPLRFATSDTVVAQIPLNSKGDSATLSWTCFHRSTSYALVFAGVPVIFFLLLLLTHCICKRRKAKRNRQTPPATSAAGAEVVANERTPLMSGGNTANEQDPLLEKIGPIPGPYMYPPSAPPNLQAVTGQRQHEPVGTDSLPVLPDVPAESPPTYEETVRADARRVAEEC